MIVFGKTVVGKSTLLHTLLQQDILAGRGVTVLDPHGNVVERTEYDGQGRAIRRWDGLLGEPLRLHYGVAGTTTITDALGRVTRVDDPCIRGMVTKVNHLVTIEEVEA